MSLFEAIGRCGLNGDIKVGHIVLVKHRCKDVQHISTRLTFTGHVDFELRDSEDILEARGIATQSQAISYSLVAATFPIKNLMPTSCSTHNTLVRSTYK